MEIWERGKDKYCALGNFASGTPIAKISPKNELAIKYARHLPDH